MLNAKDGGCDVALTFTFANMVLPVLSHHTHDRNVQKSHQLSQSRSLSVSSWTTTALDPLAIQRLNHGWLTLGVRT